MNTKFNKHIAIVVIVHITVFVLFIASIIVFAAQENNFDVPCDHHYQITDFDDGIATFICNECDDTYTEKFIDHINESYEPLDVVEDGIINAKDYAKLIYTYQK